MSIIPALHDPQFHTGDFLPVLRALRAEARFSPKCSSTSSTFCQGRSQLPNSTE
jgi:hypothetical protein